MTQWISRSGRSSIGPSKGSTDRNRTAAGTCRRSLTRLITSAFSTLTPIQTFAGQGSAEPISLHCFSQPRFNRRAIIAGRQSSGCNRRYRDVTARDIRHHVSGACGRHEIHLRGLNHHHRESAEADFVSFVGAISIARPQRHANWRGTPSPCCRRLKPRLTRARNPPPWIQTSPPGIGGGRFRVLRSRDFNRQAIISGLLFTQLHPTYQIDGDVLRAIGNRCECGGAEAF